MALLIVIVLLVLPLILLAVVVRRRSDPRLPPGNKGWPILGETIELFRGDSHEFAQKRRARYGGVFTTHLLGRPTVVASTPEAVKFFLTMPGARKCRAPRNSGTMIVGEKHLGQVDGALHARYHRVILGSMAPQTLKRHVQNIDRLAIELLTSWTSKPVIQVLEDVNKFSYEVLAGFLCEKLRPSGPETLSVMNDVAVASKGLFKLPINLPFTDYHRALQARKRLHRYLDGLITERRTSGSSQNDLLQMLMDDSKDGTNLTNKEIEDNMMVCLFAGQHTTPLTMLWMLKHLHDHPQVLKEVQEEHKGIAKTMLEEGRAFLTWEDTRNMPVTMRVLHETVRLANGGMLIREMKEDAEFNGYLIPKGWSLHIFHTSIHLTDEYFPDATKFDPSRFLVTPEPGTYSGFGTGVRACPGAELAKLEILIFFHRLITRYSWQPVNPAAHIRTWPLKVPSDGYMIRVTSTFY